MSMSIILDLLQLKLVIVFLEMMPTKMFGHMVSIMKTVLEQVEMLVPFQLEQNLALKISKTIMVGLIIGVLGLILGEGHHLILNP